MEKFRERYNIDSSMQTRAQAVAEWNRSERTGEDLYRLLLQQSATVNKNNKILGNSGAWDNVMSQLTMEGVALADPGYADTIGNLPIPPDLAARMGVKQGTTFKEQWPGRFNKLKTNIRAGYVTAVDAELKFQKADGKKLEADFIEAARTRPLSEQEVDEWKRKFGQAGLPIPSGVTNYETLSDRDQREDEDSIEALIAGIYLDGGISGAEGFISKFFFPKIANLSLVPGEEDYKTRLQEVYAKKGKTLLYKDSSKGPDHRKLFFSEVLVEEVVIGSGEGHSKKSAQQAAAEVALKDIDS